jgi:hypothetical protein
MTNWKQIEGYRYEVSDNGEVRSNIYNKILKPALKKTGYFGVVLYLDGKTKHCSIHRLVAKSFLPNPDNLPEVNHKDGNRLNNCVDNLEWVTAKQNTQHAINYGSRDFRGERNKNHKLLEKEVLEIFESSLPIKELAALYGVSFGLVGHIKCGRAWNYLTGLPKSERTS